jgi:hypothetical protein
VDYATSDGTATAGSDYTAISGTLTFTPGIMLQTFTVDIIDDIDEESYETITLTLSKADGATLGSTNNPATLTILDDDLPSVHFGTANYTVGEAGGSKTITVTLAGAHSLTVTVDYATSDGTATAGSDYVAASGTLTFVPGVTSQTFLVPITDDSLPENDETVTLTLSDPVNANLGLLNLATLTILDDDPMPTVDFYRDAYGVDEDGSPATITVTLNTALGLTVTVDYATSDGTATAGSDYTAISGTLVFTPGIAAQTFAVNIIDDTDEESDETVTLTLSSADNATLGSTNNPATLTIKDDDSEEYSIFLPLIFKNYSPPVVPPGPDLVVTGIATDPTLPGAGQPVTITVTVENQGTEAVNTWCFIDLYVDPDPPPDDRADLGIYYTYGPGNLEPGESYQAVFNHTFGSSGDHTLYAQVDTYDGFNGSPDYGLIQESDEDNNIYGPYTVGVTGMSTPGEVVPLPGTEPRPTPTAQP